MSAVAAPASVSAPVADDVEAVDPLRIGPRDHVYGEPGGLVQVVIYGHLGDERTALAYRAVHDAAVLDRCIQATLRYRLPVADTRARASAAAAEAVAPLGLYWPFVDQVFRSGTDPASLRRACRALDIDVIDECTAVPRSERRVREDHRLAEEAGATATPTVFINGVRWRAEGYGALLSDLCRLAELTRPLWVGLDPRRPGKQP